MLARLTKARPYGRKLSIHLPEAYEGRPHTDQAVPPVLMKHAGELRARGPRPRPTKRRTGFEDRAAWL